MNRTKRTQEKEGKLQCRHRERESPMRALKAKCSAIVWGTWWCGESTKFLTFQFFYCCGTSKP